MKQLKYINLNNNNIHDCIFLSNLVRLERLKLFDLIEYYDTFYANLKTLTNLCELSISIPYSYKGIWNFSDNIIFCTKLKKLDLKFINVDSFLCNSNNNINSINNTNNLEFVPILISIFNNLKFIESINLSENMMNMKEFKMLIEKVGIMSELEYLNVYIGDNNMNEKECELLNERKLNNLKMLIIKRKNEDLKFVNKMKMFLDIVLY